MPKMNRLLQAASVVAFAHATCAPALAAGTTAGTSITNQVSVDYEVNGFALSQIQQSNTITVDRKIIFTATQGGGSSTTVSPNQTNAVFAFDISNQSNDTVDLALSLAQSSGDDFNITNPRYYHDVNGDGLLDGGDVLITFIDELGEDAVFKLLVVVDVPQATVTGDEADITLTATARAGGASGTQGALLQSTTGANTAGIDTVLADAAGASDAESDGTYSVTGRVTVFSAALSVVQSHRIVTDPVNLTSNPKAIPGATVEYCIAVSNAPGNATATAVTVTDALPADVTYVSAFGIFINGTVDGSNVCNGGGTAGGTFSANTVSGALSDIAAGETRTLYFRALIN